MLEEYAWVTSPYGLGLMPEVYWRSTPRELAAYRAATEHARGFFAGLLASIQAALHNGPMTRKDGKLWEPEMFMPGYVPPGASEPAWKRDRDRMLAERARAVNPMSKPENQQNLVVINERQERARAAQERGESRETIELIMTGRA